MNIIISLYSEMSPRTYDDVERWREIPIGEETFVYLYKKNGIERYYINVKDVRRMTIEENKNGEE